MRVWTRTEVGVAVVECEAEESARGRRGIQSSDRGPRAEEVREVFSAR